jgi:hypothetical protein
MKSTSTWTPSENGGTTHAYARKHAGTSTLWTFYVSVYILWSCACSRVCVSVCVCVCVCLCVCAFVCMCVLCVGVKAKATHRALELSAGFLAYTSAERYQQRLKYCSCHGVDPANKSTSTWTPSENGASTRAYARSTLAPQRSGICMYQCMSCGLARACVCVCVCVCARLCVCCSVSVCVCVGVGVLV